MATPREYDPETGDAICERLIEGESLRSICRDPAMPATSTVCKWLANTPAFAEQYTRAREAQADTLADEIVDIADDGRRDYTNDPETGREIVDHDHIARSRLRVDARKWVASKLKPKKYGDSTRLEHSGPGGGPMKHLLGDLWSDAEGGPGQSNASDETPTA